MRILHVWDQAGVASVLAKAQKEMGHDTHVIKNIKHDKMNITSYYGGELVRNKYVFVVKAFIEARDYDLIHLHDAWFLVKMIRTAFPKKKIVMHYHGSFVRMNQPYVRRGWEEMVDALIVATPDLLGYMYGRAPVYIPNPIDVDLFKPRQHVENNRGFTNIKWDQDPKTIKEFLNSFGYTFDLDIRGRDGWIPYNKMPERLAQYEYYVDYPTYKNKVIPANSCLGLQAMSIGLKTISYDGVIRTTLPDAHTPTIAAKSVEYVYDSINKT